MLGKLIKYDLKAMLKTILPLWIVAIISSVSYGVFNSFAAGTNIANTFLLLVIFGVFVAIVVINIMLVIQRFWNGLLKDEGYLMFTIPTSPRMLIISKALSATIISVITGFVAYICVMIIMSLYMVSFENNILKEIWSILSQINGKVILSLIIFIIVAIIGTIQKIYVFYAAMALGQLSNKNRFLASFGFFMVINIVIGMFTTPLSSIFAYMANINGALDSSTFFTEAFNTIMGVAGIFSVILTIILHGIIEWILSKRLNLE